jgi:multicomponent K+:H+ antiporter subunit G
MLTLLAEILVSLLLIFGGGFAFVGSLGLAKLPDLMMRLHGPTKASTLGVGSILIASLLYFAFIEQNLSFHELLITIFLFLTAPVSAFMIAKSYIFRTRGRTTQPLPDTGRPSGWATLDAPAHDEPEQAAQLERP